MKNINQLMKRLRKTLDGYAILSLAKMCRFAIRSSTLKMRWKTHRSALILFFFLAFLTSARLSSTADVCS